MGVLRDLLRFRNIFIIILTPIILLPIILSIGTKEAKCAYIVILMAVYWITEALPIAVTSLLPIILTPLTGLGSAKTVSSKYLNDVSMLFLGGLMMAVAIEHWNIHKRLALRILLLVGSEPRWLMLGLMLPTWFLSMWISNTATTAMMIPIANAILVQLKEAKQEAETNGHVADETDHDRVRLDDVALKVNDNDKTMEQQSNGDVNKEEYEKKTYIPDPSKKENQEYKRICKMLSICIAHTANVGGIASLTGTNPNVILKGQSDIIYDKYNGTSPLTFATWFMYGLPISAIMLVLAWIWLQIFFLRGSFFKCCGGTKSAGVRIKSVLRKEYESLGPINFAQAAVIGHFFILAVLWITRDLGGAGGWGDIFPPKTVTDSTPSILISCSLFIFPSRVPDIFCLNKGKNEPISPLVPWKVAEKNLPWGVMILLGGGFALAHISEESGLSKWLGNELAVFSYLEPWVMNLVFCIVVAAATEVTSNTAICTLMMPIMAQIALQLQLNPLYIMFPTAIATSFSFMLPVATPPNAVVFSYGHLRVIDMVMVGFLMNIIGILVLILGTETWGASAFNFHTFPDIFRTNNNITDSAQNITVLMNGTCLCSNLTMT
ncbi:Na(+)/citrate cotransporter-like [Mytilus californianus]|uniref:Na(+)/citrate cotransporter-like n=1 Tax=Mytilus californianus TaxID=6549 RepID=UPI0022475159|nr:Na(+)/citrate cotransporter-like [Mytilus californianus]